jgi:hypothetical protein
VKIEVGFIVVEAVVAGDLGVELGSVSLVIVVGGLVGANPT